MDHSERLHALDAVRGFALLLGVALHGANAYIADFPWVVSDTPSTGLAVMLYVIHMFRMTVFFLIAGFFGHMAFHRKGQRAFVRDRLLRVGVPLVAGWFVLMPAMGAAIAFAQLVGNGQALPQTALAAPPAPPGSIVAAVVNQFPWAHLWFLYMLLGFYALAVAGRAVLNLVDRRGAVRRWIDVAVSWAVGSHAAPLVLGLPVLAVFLAGSDWRMWFGVPSPIQGLVPDGKSAAAFSFAFAFGWVLHRQVDLIRIWERRWALNVALALGSTAACLAIVGPNPDYTAAVSGPRTILYATLYAVATWTWVFAIIGVALRFLSAYDAARRYVADASYWVYLAHVPPVMALHGVLSRLAWPSEAKFLIVVTVATFVCLAAYQMFVRHTFIGLVLNGRRGGTHAQPPQAIDSRHGAATT